MREAGRITGEALLVARDHIRPGISTKELDDAIRHHIEKRGAKPSFLGLYGFPGSVLILKAITQMKHRQLIQSKHYMKNVAM